MAKVICMFALVGLAAAAPQSRSLPAAQDQEAVISTIMSSLQPAIDAAIARALGENSVTTITVEGTYGIPDELSGSFTGFQSTSNYQSGAVGVNSATLHDTGYPHQHDQQQQQNFASSANYGVSNSISNEKSASAGYGTSLVSTAGVNGVVYGTGNQVSDASTVTSNVNVQNVQTQVQQTEASLSKAAQSQKLVSSVLNALAPSVEAAVQRALMAMMQQNSAVSTVSTSQTSSTFSATQEQTLVTKIIEVLTPSIASSVRKALAARYEAQQAAALAEQQAAQQAAAAQLAAQQEAAAALAAQQEAAAAFAAQQEAAAAFAAQQEAAAAFAAQQEAAAAFAAQQAAAQQAAAQQAAAQQQSQSSLIAQIITALKPSIASSVSSALQANSFSQQQQSQQSQQSFNSQSSSSATSGLSSSSLGNIFGDGSAHNVKIETPDYKIEYNN